MTNLTLLQHGKNLHSDPCDSNITSYMYQSSSKSEGRGKMEYMSVLLDQMWGVKASDKTRPKLLVRHG